MWSYTNSGDKEASIPVVLENVGQRAVTLVYTNPNAPGVQMPLLTLTPATTAKAQQDGDAHAHHNQIPEAVRQFDAAAHLDKAGTGLPKAAAAKAAVGAQRSWYISVDKIEQRTASDGMWARLKAEEIAQKERRDQYEVAVESPNPRLA